MEYSFGLICDFIVGLVQIFCIECNVIFVGKVINVVWMVLCGDGIYCVIFDQVIDIMCVIGVDMYIKYKEILVGGFVINVVVNIVEC